MAGERVLVVEDNEKNMKLFRDVLQATGYSTLEATTGEDAVELALSDEPALVLMDVQLPGIDGIEALARLRARRANGLHPGAGADRAGDERRPRAVPRSRVRRLHLQADRRRRADPGRPGALRSVAERPPKILVVDDVPENVRLLEAVLAPHGYEVVTASDGLEALELVAAEEPDLILLDVMMPGLDGYAVCTHLRANDDTAMLPVIMVTSSIGQEKTKAIEAGADDFIPKPFNHDELLTRVRSLLRIKRYHDTIKAQAAELAELNRTLEERVQSQVERARAAAAAAAVPLTAARRRGRVLGRRDDPREPPPAGGDVLRRPARLVDLRRHRRARGADARTRRVPRRDRPPRETLRGDRRLPRRRRRSALLQRSDRDPRRGAAGRADGLRAARGDGRAHAQLGEARVRPRLRCRHCARLRDLRRGRIRGSPRLRGDRRSNESRLAARRRGDRWADSDRATSLCGGRERRRRASRSASSRSRGSNGPS